MITTSTVPLMCTSFRNWEKSEPLASFHFLFQGEYKIHFIFLVYVRIFYFYYNVMYADILLNLHTAHFVW